MADYTHTQQYRQPSHGPGYPASAPVYTQPPNVPRQQVYTYNPPTSHYDSQQYQQPRQPQPPPPPPPPSQPQYDPYPSNQPSPWDYYPPPGNPPPQSTSTYDPNPYRAESSQPPPAQQPQPAYRPPQPYAPNPAAQNRPPPASYHSQPPNQLVNHPPPIAHHPSQNSQYVQQPPLNQSQPAVQNPPYPYWSQGQQPQGQPQGQYTQSQQPQGQYSQGQQPQSQYSQGQHRPAMEQPERRQDPMWSGAPGSAYRPETRLTSAGQYGAPPPQTQNPPPQHHVNTPYNPAPEMHPQTSQSSYNRPYQEGQHTQATPYPTAPPIASSTSYGASGMVVSQPETSANFSQPQVQPTSPGKCRYSQCNNRRRSNSEYCCDVCKGYAMTYDKIPACRSCGLHPRRKNSTRCEKCNTDPITT